MKASSRSCAGNSTIVAEFMQFLTLPAYGTHLNPASGAHWYREPDLKYTAESASASADALGMRIPVT